MIPFMFINTQTPAYKVWLTKYSECLKFEGIYYSKIHIAAAPPQNVPPHLDHTCPIILATFPNISENPLLLLSLVELTLSWSFWLREQQKVAWFQASWKRWMRTHSFMSLPCSWWHSAETFTKFLITPGEDTHRRGLPGLLDKWHDWRYKCTQTRTNSWRGTHGNAPS